jgi:hypothetical protein
MSSLNIISSFLINTTTAGDYRTNINFGSQSITNSDLIEMPSGGTIQNIDIQVYWCDKFGNVRPLMMAPGKQIDLRLAFVKK